MSEVDPSEREDDSGPASRGTEGPKRASAVMRGRRRGIYLLPSIFTTGALFAGFYAMIAALNGAFPVAAIAVLVALILDGLDGRIARLTQTQSEFGAEYDSLSDMVSFGVAPAVIIYLWSLQHFSSVTPAWDHLGWLAAFVFSACAALRLARFNCQLGTADKRFFQGLASPSAALIVVSFVWACEDLGLSGDSMVLVALPLTIGAGLLMVSNLPFYSFKDLGTMHRVPFFTILAVVGLLVLATLDPPKVLFSGFLLYGLSGPAWWLWRRPRRWWRRGTNPPPGEE